MGCSDGEGLFWFWIGLWVVWFVVWVVLVGMDVLSWGCVVCFCFVGVVWWFGVGGGVGGFGWFVGWGFCGWFGGVVFWDCLGC